MQALFAALVALHGMVHLVEFTVPWRMNLDLGRIGVDCDSVRTEIVGETARAPGAAWLVAGLAFVAAAVGVARCTVWAGPLLGGAAIFSTALCAAGPRNVRHGILADVLILAFLLV